MGLKKQFQSSAKLRIGKTPTGGYKLYVVGRSRTEPGEFWVVAGSDAQRPSTGKYLLQKPRGYGTKAEALEFGQRAFPTRAAFIEFISQPLGSASIDTSPDLEADVVDLWA